MDTEELTIYDLLEELKDRCYKAYLNKIITFETYKRFYEYINVDILEIKRLEEIINGDTHTR